MKGRVHCVLGLDLVSAATSPGSWQQHPHESKSLPFSLVNPVCLWVQKCLNQCAPEILNAMA